MKYILVSVTCGSKSEAEKIVRHLVGQRLAACGNIIGQINSVFRWKGKVERARECMIIMKTKKSHFGGVVKQVKKLHSYEVPEIISIPILAGNKEYLDWINDSVL